MHRIDLTSVYVLHTRPYSNSSLIVELFSKNHGRVAAVAKSARGPTSRFKGQLQLFTPLLVSWMGQHELKTLTHAELNGMPLQLNHQSLFCGFYLNELLMKLLHKEDPHPNLFDCYHDSLCCLESSAVVAILLRRFEKRLLEELGYALPLQYEAKSQVLIHAEKKYRYEHQHGFVISNDDYDHSALIFLGQDLIAIREEKFDVESVVLSAKKLMRVVLANLLGNKPIWSRELF